MIIDNDKLKFISKLSTHEKETLQNLAQRLEKISEKSDLTEAFWRDFNNLTTDINLFKETITNRLINLLKANMEV